MSKNIESHLNENRVIKPSKQFSRNARIGSLAEYKRLHKESIKSPSKFWGREAGELKWQKKMEQGSRVEGSLREMVYWWKN